MNIGDIIKLNAYWTLAKDYDKLGIILDIYNSMFEDNPKQYKVWFFIDQKYEWIFSNEISKV